jgi:tRNA(Ile)-lysidine synthase
MIFEKFISNIERNAWRNVRIVVAISGGLDSMTLAKLLLSAKKYYSRSPHGLLHFDFVLAHCNYKLRGEESNGDEAHVRKWAAQNNIPLHVKQIDTPAILAQEKGNLQARARELRYEWLEHLRKELDFDCIATAHHQQDAVETVLMNFFKGTGIRGLHGILPEQKRLIRPLITFKKEELEQYAISEGLAWREDSSNKKTDYLRNAIRLQIIPQLEQIIPGVMEHVYANSLRFGEVEELYNQSIQRYKKRLVEQRGKDWFIPLRKLINCRPLATIIFEILQPFGLKPKQLQDVLQLIHSDTGRFIDFEKFRIIKDRNFFIITELNTVASEHVLVKGFDEEVSTAHFRLQLKQLSKPPNFAQITASEAYLDADMLSMPLTLRPWKEGDYLYPLGMGMKKKKVKKLLIDLKMPIHEKEKVWVLASEQKIVWVCGIRMDERFKLGTNTKDIIQIKLLPLEG